MKYLKILNTIAILIPILICISELWQEGNFVLGLTSTIVTGLIQVVIAIIYFYKYPKETPIKIYFIGLFLFILLFLITPRDDWYWILPPVLFFLLSYIIYSKKVKLPEKKK